MRLLENMLTEGCMVSICNAGWLVAVGGGSLMVAGGDWLVVGGDWLVVGGGGLLAAVSVGGASCEIGECRMEAEDDIVVSKSVMVAR